MRRSLIGGLTKTIRALAALSLAVSVGAQQPDIGDPPGRLYDVGGRRLHVMCSGAGAPTVILEAGASSFAIDWTLVQAQVSRTNRVCSYDRAGHGWSDSAGAPSVSSVSVDLHLLLEKAGERAPYVLVGASAGGLHVRMFQADYPSDVVEMVLVDPASEDRLFTFFQGEAVAIASLSAEQYRTTFPTNRVRVPRRRPQTGAPFDKLPAGLYQTRIKLDEKLIASIPDVVTPEWIAEFRETERARLARLMAIRTAKEKPLGDLPVVVLSRGVEASTDMLATHAGLAALSTNSRHATIAGSGHEIHLFAPDVVAQAIADVVSAARGKTRLPAR